jgi:spermidine synthase
MIPWIQLAEAEVPDGGVLRLMRRGAEFSIMAGPIELMNSRLSGSERALATLVCERLGPVKAPEVLIGGLGMGFTLRAALADLPSTARVVVAELIPAVVAWARDPLSHIFEGSLEDPRVTIRETDVAALIAEAKSGFDAILLDVDNGPGGLSREANDGLYSAQGLAAARRALRPGGILAVWSSGPSREFTSRLHRAGFRTEEVKVRANRTGKGARHVIWLAAAP